MGETGSVSSSALASGPVFWGKDGRVLLSLSGSPSPWTMASVPTSIESAYSPGSLPFIEALHLLKNHSARRASACTQTLSPLEPQSFMK